MDVVAAGQCGAADCEISALVREFLRLRLWFFFKYLSQSSLNSLLSKSRLNTTCEQHIQLAKPLGSRLSSLSLFW